MPGGPANRMERPELWGHLKDAPDIAEKIRVFRELVPDDVRTIVDVGCGDGAITNALAERWEVTGVDSSREALQYVSTSSVLADARNLPFGDSSFDLALSSQMLEHLDDLAYVQAVAELQRVARRYALISVPHEEDIGVRMIRCPSCGSQEHAWGHVRRFTSESLATEFSDFDVVEVRIFGDLQEPSWPRALLWAMHKVLRSWYQPEGQTPQCSCCGNTDYSGVRSFSPYPVLVKRAFDRLLLRRRTPYWLAVVMRRRAAT